MPTPIAAHLTAPAHSRRSRDLAASCNPRGGNGNGDVTDSCRSIVAGADCPAKVAACNPHSHGIMTVIRGWLGSIANRSCIIQLPAKPLVDRTQRGCRLWNRRHAGNAARRGHKTCYTTNRCRPGIDSALALIGQTISSVRKGFFNGDSCRASSQDQLSL